MGIKAPPPALWDWSGLYIGGGGSFNWAHVEQSLQGVSGTVNVFNGPVLVAQGQEGGPFFKFNRNKSRFAPDVQLGYIVPLHGSDWLFGLKLTYKYANVESKKNVIIPQNGNSSIVSGPLAGFAAPITGFVQISPAEVNLTHQLSPIATIGRAFGNVALYAGGGPALFDVKTKFLNGIPFAVSPGPFSLTFPASVPVTFSNDNWVWGGAAQVGAMYTFGRGWFLDLNYTYARSAMFKTENPLIAHSQDGPFTLIGPAVLNSRERVANQSVTLTLNYKFYGSD